MNSVNSKKLLHSKWTAVKPQNREKHFIVTKVLCDNAGVVRRCVLEAVHSHREMTVAWRELRSPDAWTIGWR